MPTTQSQTKNAKELAIRQKRKGNFLKCLTRPVTGLTTKMCQLISGRVSPTHTRQKTKKPLADTDDTDDKTAQVVTAHLRYCR